MSDTEGGRVIACRDHYCPLRVIFASGRKKTEEKKKQREKERKKGDAERERAGMLVKIREVG